MHDRDLLVTLGVGFTLLVLVQTATAAARSWAVLVLLAGLAIVLGREPMVTHVLKVPQIYREETIASCVLLGLAESFGAGLISSKYKDAIAFLIILAVLFARPQGLLGERRLHFLWCGCVHGEKVFHDLLGTAGGLHHPRMAIKVLEQKLLEFGRTGTHVFAEHHQCGRLAYSLHERLV